MLIKINLPINNGLKIKVYNKNINDITSVIGIILFRDSFDMPLWYNFRHITILLRKADCTDRFSQFPFLSFTLLSIFTNFSLFSKISNIFLQFILLLTFRSINSLAAIQRIQCILPGFLS